MHRASGPYGPFRHQLRAFARETKDVHAGDAEALHRARVATRRMRELLPVLGLDGGPARKLGHRLRKVTRQLGAVRQLDVLMATIQEFQGDARYSPTALARVGPAVADARTAAHDHLMAKLPLAKMQRLVHRLERMVDQLEAEKDRNHRRSGPRRSQAWMLALDARVVRRATRVRAAIERAGAIYAPPRLHEVRIAVKKLRYAMEFLKEARAGRPARDLETLKTAQDLLGRLHDLEILIQRTRDEYVSLAPPSPVARREFDSLVRALERDCRALHARYMRLRTALLAIADRVIGAPGHMTLVGRRAAG